MTKGMQFAIVAAVFVALWCLFAISSGFRKDFADWVSLKDPLGTKFWGNNKLFAVLSILLFAFAAVFLPF